MPKALSNSSLQPHHTKKMNKDELNQYLLKNWISVPNPIRPNMTIKVLQNAILLSFGRIGLFSNWIIESNFSTMDLHKTLEEAIHLFNRKLKTGFSWVVPSEKLSSHLQDFLEKHGFECNETVDILVKRIDEAKESPSNRMRLVKSIEDLETAIRLDDSYEEHNEEQRKASIKKNISKLTSGESGWIIGSIANKDVAMTSFHFMKDKTILYLSGATTLPKYRTKGLYTEMLNYRLYIGKKNGAIWAATHAIQESSSPILQKRGFEKLSSIHVFGRKGIGA